MVDVTMLRERLALGDSQHLPLRFEPFELAMRLSSLTKGEALIDPHLEFTCRLPHCVTLIPL